MALVTSILNGQGSPLPVNSNQQLADMLGSLAFTIWFIPPYGTIGIVSL